MVVSVFTFDDIRDAHPQHERCWLDLNFDDISAINSGLREHGISNKQFSRIKIIGADQFIEETEKKELRDEITAVHPFLPHLRNKIDLLLCCLEVSIEDGLVTSFLGEAYPSYD